MCALKKKTMENMMTPARKEPDKSTYAGRFAMRLRELRLKAGLTAEEAAEKIGVATITIYDWESCKNLPRASKYPAIASSYKLSMVRDVLPQE
ncbi:MAG: helix-turn-helix transcriptional regulator [Planctomycetia bacterium]|nr:helix-turn-helix transcriptional regulator [Planctomycetia bacterium]